MATNEKLQSDIIKQKQVENALKKDSDQLEPYLREQVAKLRTANEQLQQETACRSNEAPAGLHCI